MIQLEIFATIYVNKINFNYQQPHKYVIQNRQIQNRSQSRSQSQNPNHYFNKTNPYLVSAGECIICVTNLPRYLVIQATVKTSFLILVVIK